jgi:hypothetical protein
VDDALKMLRLQLELLMLRYLEVQGSISKTFVGSSGVLNLDIQFQHLFSLSCMAFLRHLVWLYV